MVLHHARLETTRTIIPRSLGSGGVMSKTIIAVGAFILGTCCGFMLNNRVPIVAASAPLNSQASDSRPRRSIFHGGGVANAGTGVSIVGAIPSFIPLETTPIFEDFTFSNVGQPLDGLDCRGCKFNDATLRYSGGAYNLENAKFSGTTRLVLDGAAANTLAFLKFLNGLSMGIPPASLPPNKPIKRKAIAKKPIPKIDFTAPFIGPK